MIDGIRHSVRGFEGNAGVRATTQPRPYWLVSDPMLVSSGFLGVAALLYIGYAEDSLVSTLVITWLWVVVGGALVGAESLASPIRTPIVRLFWVTLGLRLFVGTCLHSALNGTEFGPWWNFGSQGGDEATFWLNSERMLEAWRNGTVLQEEAREFVNYFGWLHIVGFVRFLGEQMGADTVFNAKLILAIASALVVPYTYLLSRRVFDERVARIAAALAFFLPDYWFYSSALLRDVLVSAAMVIFFYQVVCVATWRFSWWRFAFLVVLNFGLIRYLRTDLSIMNIALVALFWIWGHGRDVTNVIIRFGRIVALGSLVLTVLIVVAPGVYSSASLYSGRTLSIDYIDARAEVMSSAGLEQASTESLGARVLQAPNYIRWPLETGFVLLQPFPPWAALQGGITEPFPLKSWIDTILGLVWYGWAVFLPAGAAAVMRRHPRSTVWVWGTPLMLLLALGFASGAHPRWRLMFTPFVLIVLAQGILERRRFRSLVWVGAIWLGSLLTLYSVIKYA